MKNIVFALLYVGALSGAINETSTNKLLSRRKRYLIFPEGSSLQLVYCLTMPVIGRSTIFTIGGTAALAWELPHDPFTAFRKPAEVLHRVDPPGAYTIQDLPSKLPTRPPITLLGAPPSPSPISYRDPSSAVRFPSIRLSPSYNRYRYRNYLQQQRFPAVLQQFPGYYHQQSHRMVNNDARPGFPSAPTASIYHQVHRRTRRDLYGKIEKFLNAQSKDGKACLLKIICEIHQRKDEKGGFLEEILKAIFKVKPFEEYASEDVYDEAANRQHNCTEMFPTCDSTLRHFI